MEPTKLVYLACPYSHRLKRIRERRFEAANLVASKLMRAGVMVFSPISHTHPIAEHGLPKGWEFWQQYDCEMLRICRALVVLTLDGWIESVGVQEEIRLVRELDRPVYLLRSDQSVQNVVRMLSKV